MRANELVTFLKRHDITAEGLADVLGITKQAVDHWINTRRAIPETVARLVRMFDENPEDVSYFKSFASVEDQDNSQC